MTEREEEIEDLKGEIENYLVELFDNKFCNEIPLDKVIDAIAEDIINLPSFKKDFFYCEEDIDKCYRKVIVDALKSKYK